MQHVQSCTAWSHFITRNTRGSKAAKLRIVHLCVFKTIVIRMSCVVLCCTWHWPQAQVLSHLSHLLLLPFRQSQWYTQDLWFSTQICPAMFHGRVADQHKSHLSHFLDMGMAAKQQKYPYYVRGDEPHMCNISDDELDNDLKDAWTDVGTTKSFAAPNERWSFHAAEEER